MQIKGLAAAWALALVFQSPAALATTYYVSSGVTGRDSNAGTSSTAPFLTIKHAADLTKPGDTVNIMTGTYAPFGIYPSGTATAYITYQPLAGHHPVILKDSTLANGATIKANYIIFQGLTVLGNAQSVTLTQAKTIPAGGFLTNGHCIAVGAGFHHVKIIGNTVSYCPGAGIMYLGDYGWIYRNTAHHNAFWSPQAESGIVIQGTNTDTSTAPKIFVYDNLVYGNQQYLCRNPTTTACIWDGQGIIVDSNIDTAYTGRIKIYNNITYNNGNKGIVVHRSAHVDVYNNTSYYNNVSATEPAPFFSNLSGGEIAITSSDDVKVENNIMYGNPAVPVLYYSGLSSDTNVTWDYNVIWGPNAARIGPHDIVGDPMFTSWFMPPKAFGLQEGSVGIGAGTPDLMPPTDYNGNVRFAARVDCGAYTGWN